MTRRRLNIARIGSLFTFCLWIGFSGASWAQSQYGSIKGKVIDKATKEGLVAVNILVKGTYYGASTDIDGNFVVNKVNPGTYVIDVTLLGYKSFQFGSVKVTAGEVTELNVTMEESSLSLGQDVVIIGEKPLFDIQETSSKRGIKAEEIAVTGVQDVRDIVSQQTGVVKSDDQIYIRGSRGYENAYLIDGVSVQDPLAGTGFGMSLPPGAIQEVEVITGGYNAEYGQATSGVISFTTKEGSDKYTGGFSYKRDHLGFNDNQTSNTNTDIYEMYLSGPEPITQLISALTGEEPFEKITFFGNFNVNYSDGYTRWVEKLNSQGAPIGWELKAPGGLNSSIFHGTDYAPRRSNLYSGLAKWTWRVSPTVKVSYALTGSVGINQNTQTIQTTLERQEPLPGYQYLFQSIPDSANTFTQINIQHAFIFSDNISAKTFYEVRLSRYTAHVRGDANGKYWDAYREPKDIVSYPITYFQINPYTLGVIPGDGFYEMGSPSGWRDHYVDETTFKVDVTSHFNELNKFKSGVELRFQHLQMVDIVNPWVRPLGYDNDIYTVDPMFGAVYAQDNINFGGMILNFGLRFDFWRPGKYVDDAVNNDEDCLVSPTLRQQYLNNTYNLFGARWKGRISPRVAVAHPVSDNQTLFFSYGHFSKFPRPQFVYSKLLRSSARSTFQLVGNPDLNPETTVAYELGLRNQFTENDVLTVTAYYKDIFDYITARSIKSEQTRFSGGSYQTYVNLDYARSRGIEVEYKTRYSTWFRGSISGSYSIATGKSSAANEALFNIQKGEEEQIKEQNLVWDRPLQGSIVLNLKIPKNQPLFGADGILEDINVYTRAFFQSGRRYTLQDTLGTDPNSGRLLYVSDPKLIYTEIAKNIFTIDMNIERYIDFGPVSLTISFEIQNLLDRKNVQIVNPVTGDGYEYMTNGKPTPTPMSWNDPHYPDLQAPVDPYPYNPARFQAPRTYRLGLGVKF
jgi:outer membrane receptor protein involved in Fe transport